MLALNCFERFTPEAEASIINRSGHQDDMFINLSLKQLYFHTVYRNIYRTRLTSVREVFELKSVHLGKVFDGLTDYSQTVLGAFSISAPLILKLSQFKLGIF